MKKIININFQGRVVPIEESAYEILKQYVESLRRYFANEEGRDEIINDIESRIAELFFERLKKGATCITDDDVNAVIGSIGRPKTSIRRIPTVPPVIITNTSKLIHSQPKPAAQTPISDVEDYIVMPMIKFWWCV
jgi:hypothetical protein